MDDFVQSKQVYKSKEEALLYHDPLKRLKLKTFAWDLVIKKDTSR